MKKDNNPLKMEPIGPEGPFVLPKQTCSKRRKEYFIRSNRILGTYMTISAFSNTGYSNFVKSGEENKFEYSRSIRITMGSRIVQSKYGTFKKMYTNAGGQFTNYIFLMIYGNFEAFVSDLVQDAFYYLGSTDPIQDTISLLITNKWESKIQKISNKFDVDLRGRVFKQQYQNIKMGFFDEPHKSPVSFMESMAEMRHRLVHSSGRIDKKLLEKYPKMGRLESELIELPFEFPYDLNYFFAPLTDIFDKAFCEKFSWDREEISPGDLVEI